MSKSVRGEWQRGGVLETAPMADTMTDAKETKPGYLNNDVPPAGVAPPTYVVDAPPATNNPMYGVPYPGAPMAAPGVAVVNGTVPPNPYANDQMNAIILVAIAAIIAGALFFFGFWFLFFIPAIIFCFGIKYRNHPDETINILGWVSFVATIALWAISGIFIAVFAVIFVLIVLVIIVYIIIIIVYVVIVLLLYVV